VTRRFVLVTVCLTATIAFLIGLVVAGSMTPQFAISAPSAPQLPVRTRVAAGMSSAVTSFAAVLIAGPLAIAIALFLTELAPRSSRTVIGTLVELLAGIPSVILGLWGIIVLGPVLNDTIEPALHSVLGWIPLFGGTYSLVGLFPAILILTIAFLPHGLAGVARSLRLRWAARPRDGAPRVDQIVELGEGSGVR